MIIVDTRSKRRATIDGREGIRFLERISRKKLRVRPSDLQSVAGRSSDRAHDFPEVETCKYTFTRIDTIDPGVGTCP